MAICMSWNSLARPWKRWASSRMSSQSAAARTVRASRSWLPCPNLFTGGANFHGRFEYLPLPSLQKAAEVVLAIMIKAGEQCKAVNERK